MSASPQDHQAPLSVLSVRLYKEAPAFSLKLKKGEALSLLGENAETLSLFCDMLAGFATPVAGQIMINGIEATHLPPEKRAIGLVSARDPVFDHLDVAANIAFPLRVRGIGSNEIHATVSRVLALLGLDALASTRADKLSAEHNVRLRLARVLAYAPSVLILDDILSGLDLRATSKTRQLLTKLQKALGLTLIYTANSREDSVWLGGRIGLFDHQTLVQCADASTLLERPADSWVAALFGEANLLTGRVLSIDDDVATVHLACGGVVEAMSDPDLAEDTLCILCIRPDRMTPLFAASLANDDEAPPLVATLQSVLHTGEQLRFRLRLSDGVEIDMRRPLLQSARTMKPGAPVQLAWQASQAVAFPMKDDL